MGDGRHGIARYVLSMAPHLVAASGTEWTAVCAPAWEERFRSLGMRTVVTGLRFTSPLAPFQLARIQRDVRPDVTFCPSFVPPLPSRGPLVMTIHDATHLLRPADYSPLVRLYYRAVTLPVARRSRVLTVSEFSKSALERAAGLAAVTVAYPGVDLDRFGPDGPSDARIPERSILYAGGYKPHKRVELLIDALSGIPGATLALVGAVPAGLTDRARSLGLEDRILRLGPLDDDELAMAYRSATVFSYPSALEGFGLPPLEAMACGTPVVVADSSSLPEVVGDAGVLVAGEVPALAAAIAALLDDDAARSRSRDAGLARAKRFAWRTTASATVDLLREASGSAG